MTLSQCVWAEARKNGLIQQAWLAGDAMPTSVRCALWVAGGGEASLHMLKTTFCTGWHGFCL